MEINQTRVRLARKSLDELYDSLPTKIDLRTMNLDLMDVMTIKAIQNNVVNIEPQCLCGEATGAELLGDSCIKCTTVVSDYIGAYQPLVWVSTQDGAKRFVAPQYWAMLNLILKDSDKFDSLAYLTNKRYKSSLTIPKVLDNIIRDIPNFQRNYTWVVENLETILNYLLNITSLYDKRNRIRIMLDLYKNQKDKILSAHVPIPSKELFLVEDTQFSNKKLNLVTGVVKSLALNYRDAIDNGRSVDDAMSRLVSELATVYNMNVEDLINGKKRVIRTSIFGTKVPGSFRTVMIAISGPHLYDDFIMPWIEAIITFRPYIMSRLADLNYGYLDACEKIDLALFTYDKEIDDILEAILAEAKAVNGRGICITQNRNPTQHRFSLIQVYIVKIKKDPLDYSSETSVLLCAAFNGDFDGDEENMTIANDMETEREFKKFALHRGAFIPNKPFNASKTLSAPDTMVVNISSYIMESRKEELWIDPELLKLIS